MADDEDVALDLDIEDDSPGGDSKPNPEVEADTIETPEAEAEEPRQDRAADDEDASYGAKVRKRIDKEVWRRKSAEEEANRLKAELAALRADVEQIKVRHTVAEAQATEGQWRDQLAAAQKRLRDAKENGDIDAEIQAADDYAEARDRLRSAEAARKQQQETPASAPATSATLPAGTRAWLAKNAWFQSGANPRAVRLAVELDAELQADGYSPHDPAMYAELNKRLRAALPNIAPLLGDMGGQRTPGPPTGTSSADGESRSAPKKRQLSREDLAEMKAYGLNPGSMEDRKAWLRAHQ